MKRFNVWIILLVIHLIFQDTAWALAPRSVELTPYSVRSDVHQWRQLPSGILFHHDNGQLYVMSPRPLEGEKSFQQLGEWISLETSVSGHMYAFNPYPAFRLKNDKSIHESQTIKDLYQLSRLWHERQTTLARYQVWLKNYLTQVAEIMANYVYNIFKPQMMVRWSLDVLKSRMFPVVSISLLCLACSASPNMTPQDPTSVEFHLRMTQLSADAGSGRNMDEVFSWLDLPVSRANPLLNKNIYDKLFEYQLRSLRNKNLTADKSAHSKFLSALQNLPAHIFSDWSSEWAKKININQGMNESGNATPLAYIKWKGDQELKEFNIVEKTQFMETLLYNLSALNYKGRNADMELLSLQIIRQFSSLSLSDQRQYFKHTSFFKAEVSQGVKFSPIKSLMFQVYYKNLKSTEYQQFIEKNQSTWVENLSGLLSENEKKALGVLHVKWSDQEAVSIWLEAVFGAGSKLGPQRKIELLNQVRTMPDYDVFAMEYLLPWILKMEERVSELVTLDSYSEMSDFYFSLFSDIALIEAYRKTPIFDGIKPFPFKDLYYREFFADMLHRVINPYALKRLETDAPAQHHLLYGIARVMSPLELIGLDANAGKKLISDLSKVIGAEQGISSSQHDEVLSLFLLKILRRNVEIQPDASTLKALKNIAASGNLQLLDRLGRYLYIKNDSVLSQNILTPTDPFLPLIKLHQEFVHSLGTADAVMTVQSKMDKEHEILESLPADIRDNPSGHMAYHLWSFYFLEGVTFRYLNQQDIFELPLRWQKARELSAKVSFYPYISWLARFTLAQNLKMKDATISRDENNSLTTDTWGTFLSELKLDDLERVSTEKAHEIAHMVNLMEPVVNDEELLGASIQDIHLNNKLRTLLLEIYGKNMETLIKSGVPMESIIHMPLISDALSRDKSALPASIKKTYIQRFLVAHVRLSMLSPFERLRWIMFSRDLDSAYSLPDGYEFTFPLHPNVTHKHTSWLEVRKDLPKEHFHAPAHLLAMEVDRFADALNADHDVTHQVFYQLFNGKYQEKVKDPFEAFVVAGTVGKLFKKIRTHKDFKHMPPSYHADLITILREMVLSAGADKVIDTVLNDWVDKENLPQSMRQREFIKDKHLLDSVGKLFSQFDEITAKKKPKHIWLLIVGKEHSKALNSIAAEQAGLMELLKALHMERLSDDIRSPLISELDILNLSPQLFGSNAGEKHLSYPSAAYLSFRTAA